ncbi:WD40 repeat domain-containing protein [Acidobacteriota bacterium]
MKAKLFGWIIIMIFASGMAVSAEDIDLLASAAAAQWINSDSNPLVFGTDGQNKGTAKYLNDARLEDGQTYARVLFTHPQWKQNGIIRGAIHSVRIPEGGAKLVISGGFLDGAAGSDGVVFSVQFLRSDTVPRLTTKIADRGTSICNFNARYDRRIDRNECDISQLGGQVGTFILSVSAGSSADSDWAAWTEAKILTSSPPPVVKEEELGASEAVVSMVNVYKGHDYRINSIQPSPNGQYVLTVDSDNQAKVWPFPGGQTKLILRGDYSSRPSFSPDSRYVAVGKRRGAVEVWEISSENLVKTFQGHSGEVYTANFSPDGKFIVSAGADGYAKVWEFFSGREISSIKHSDRVGISVRSAVFTPDGRHIITAGEDSVARIWEFKAK